MNHRGKVLIAAPIHAVLFEGLLELGFAPVEFPEITQEMAFGLIADCVGVVTSTRLNLNKELIAAGPNLQWIARMGSGMEVIDLDYAATQGITCIGSPEGNSNAVAEHALGMLLSLTKKITGSSFEVREGLWLREENRGIELEGRTIGIIGYGHTGQAFARKLRGMDMNILVYDKYNPPVPNADITICPDLLSIFQQAEIVSFHVPFAADTVHYLNEGFVEAMHHPFILINTARGKVVDTLVLNAGLESGKIVGACLDVWEWEPLSKSPPSHFEVGNSILCRKNVIITPHIGGYSHEALFKMSKVLLDKLKKLLSMP
jgi:D-3-phosphoglycerate dehydrogenase